MISISKKITLKAKVSYKKLYFKAILLIIMLISVVFLWNKTTNRELGNLVACNKNKKEIVLISGAFKITKDIKGTKEEDPDPLTDIVKVYEKGEYVIIDQISRNVYAKGAQRGKIEDSQHGIHWITLKDNEYNYVENIKVNAPFIITQDIDARETHYDDVPSQLSKTYKKNENVIIEEMTKDTEGNIKGKVEDVSFGNPWITIKNTEGEEFAKPITDIFVPGVFKFTEDVESFWDPKATDTTLKNYKKGDIFIISQVQTDDQSIKGFIEKQLHKDGLWIILRTKEGKERARPMYQKVGTSAMQLDIKNYGYTSNYILPVVEIGEHNLEEDGFELLKLNEDQFTDTNLKILEDALNKDTELNTYFVNPDVTAAMKTVVYQHVKKQDKYKNMVIDVMLMDEGAFFRSSEKNQNPETHIDYASFQKDWTKEEVIQMESKVDSNKNSELQQDERIIKPQEIINIWGPLENDKTTTNILGFVPKPAEGWKNENIDWGNKDNKGNGVTGFLKQSIPDSSKKYVLKTNMPKGWVYIFRTSGLDAPGHSAITIKGEQEQTRKSFEYRFLIVEIKGAKNEIEY